MMGGSLLLQVLAGCAAYPEVGILPHRPRVADIDIDSALIAAAIRSQLPYLGPRQPLRIDPRPLERDNNIVEPHPDNIDKGAELVVRERTRIAQQLGATLTDAWEDFRCVNPGAAPPPPPAGTRDPADGPDGTCAQKGQFQSLILGIPRPGGAYYPEGSIDERDHHGDAVWTVRMLASGFDGYVAYDIVLTPRPGSKVWLVLDRKILYSIVS